MSLIEIDNVTKVFQRDFSRKVVRALSSITFHVSEGEVFGFLGPNGAGKSTTIKLLMNLIRPTEGRLSINGKEVGDKNVRRLIGYLPENPYYYDRLTAEELLWFGGKSCGMRVPEIRRRSNELLEELDLADAMRRPLHSYSKGMVQRAGLALALIHDPMLLVLDEPMSGLDPLGRNKIFSLILRLKQHGKTVFFSSHILHDIERLCDRAAILMNGKLARLLSIKQDLPVGTMLEDLFFSEVAKSGGLRE